LTDACCSFTLASKERHTSGRLQGQVVTRECHKTVCRECDGCDAVRMKHGTNAENAVALTSAQIVCASPCRPALLSWPSLPSIMNPYQHQLASILSSQSGCWPFSSRETRNDVHFFLQSLYSVSARSIAAGYHLTGLGGGQSPTTEACRVLRYTTAFERIFTT
jgi:hypothetical protein